MQEAEDGITGVAALERATVQAQVAVTSARRVFDMATSRYEGGASGYLDVITAQQTLLSSEQRAAGRAIAGTTFADHCDFDQSVGRRPGRTQAGHALTRKNFYSG